MWVDTRFREHPRPYRLKELLQINRRQIERREESRKLELREGRAEQ